MDPEVGGSVVGASRMLHDERAQTAAGFSTVAQAFCMGAWVLAGAPSNISASGLAQ